VGVHAGSFGRDYDGLNVGIHREEGVMLQGMSSMIKLSCEYGLSHGYDSLVRNICRSIA
jgi:hypothetical protein